MELHSDRRSLSSEFRRSRAPLTVAFFLVTVAASSASFDNITFDFPRFVQDDLQIIKLDGDATLSTPSIQLTTNQRDKISNNSNGWAKYVEPMHLWDNTTGNIADFSTRFSFVIDSLNSSLFADGFTFYLAPNGSEMARSVEGGRLALIPSSNYGSSGSMDHPPFIAVEFDTFSNSWDPGYPQSSVPHVGIDINSIESVVTKEWSWNKIRSGGQAAAWITYNSSTTNLSVLLVDESGFGSTETLSLSYQVNLTDYLPEWVTFGFSGSTGFNYEIHKITSWEFSSSLQIANPADETNQAPPPLQITIAPTPPPQAQGAPRRKKSKTRVWIILPACAGGAFLLLIVVAVIAWFRRSPKGVAKCPNREEDGNAMPPIDEEFEKVAGPRKFSYEELAKATNDFADDRLLAEGGSGKVYEGYLIELEDRVAIKKITSDSEQGLKEYAAEVKAVSQLRHRSLVQLIGWCHEQKELLIIYEFMTNGSLDSHLFKNKSLLTWEARYTIAQDLASAILYLHEDWAQCVVHRDIKCSNILLDSSFNAKLGDFGLSRLIDHRKGSQTTMLAGTWGYMAPEYVFTSRASKESDVYSFGVVTLEIACGRKAIEPKAKEGCVALVNWVWELYGSGRLLDATDPRLEGSCNSRSMELLMTVGLWCAHPDYTLRPSIREALSVLKFNASPPVLPPKMPVLTYANMNGGDITSYTTKSSTFTSSSNPSTSSPTAL